MIVLGVLLLDSIFFGGGVLLIHALDLERGQGYGSWVDGLGDVEFTPFVVSCS